MKRGTMNGMAAEEGEGMTDFQFKSLIKMIFGYVEEAGDIEKIKKYLRGLLNEDEKSGKDK
ncbi:MAG: hypothetical protein LBO82_01025 [Synergistaceae bacterium]|nr:hypothetical protein [Synergistaceae bacterium]